MCLTEKIYMLEKLGSGMTSVVGMSSMLMNQQDASSRKRGFTDLYIRLL